MRLARVGADLLVDTLPGYFSGDIVPRPQSEHGVTFARRLRKADGMLNWSQPAVQLERQLRAFTPWPGVYTTWKGRKLRILRASAVPCLGRDGPPGTVVSLDDGVAVIAGDGALRLKEVQLAGRRRMDIAAFLCGQRECIGSSFGSEG